jgi:hypothetical protein
MKDRGLPADTRMVDRRARIDICSHVEQELDCLQIAATRSKSSVSIARFSCPTSVCAATACAATRAFIFTQLRVP